MTTPNPHSQSLLAKKTTFDFPRSIRKRPFITIIVIVTWSLILFFFINLRSSNSLSNSIGHLSSVFHPTLENSDANDEWYLRLSGKSRPGKNPTGFPLIYGGISSIHNKNCFSNYLHVNPDHSNQYIGQWAAISDDVILQKRSAWQNYINSSKVKTSYDQNKFNGRGILFTAGNKDTYDRVLTTLKLLRFNYSCSLPAEVWYFQGELNQKQKETLKTYNAEPRDLSESKNGLFMTKDNVAWKNFQIKSAAIINSQFQEILYLDSDNMPLKNPNYLFDSSEYQKTGALFWPDYWKTHPSNPIWNIMNVDCESDWEQEAGQMVIDKKRHWEPLHLSYYMQANNDFYFTLLMGDKDTFRFAWKALKHDYTYPPRFLSAVGLKLGPRKQFCGHTMLQYDFENNPLFVHGNLIKMFPVIAFQQSKKMWMDVKRYTNDLHRNFINLTMWYYMEGICIDFFPTQYGEDEKVGFSLSDLFIGPKNKGPEFEIASFEKTVSSNFENMYWEQGGIGGKRELSNDHLVQIRVY